MMKNILKISALGLLAVSMLGLPFAASAQSTNAPSEKKSSKKDSARGHAFHGKITAVDKTEKTVTVGKSTYTISSETAIKKDGKPATLEDGVVGDDCAGYIRTNSAGKGVVISLRFGPAPASDKKSKTPKPDTTQ